MKYCYENVILSYEYMVYLEFIAKCDCARNLSQHQTQWLSFYFVYCVFDIDIKASFTNRISTAASQTLIDHNANRSLLQIPTLTKLNKILLTSFLFISQLYLLSLNIGQYIRAAALKIILFVHDLSRPFICFMAELFRIVMQWNHWYN